MAYISGLFLWKIFPLVCLINISAGQLRSPEITEHPADLLVPRNEPATLNCKAVGKPKPKITWFKNGQEFKIKKEGGRHVLLENGDLFFLRVLQTKKEDDSGHYWCQASNEVSTVSSKNASLEIAVLKDEFTEVPEHARVAEGATALLRCIPPKGHPEPVVVWTKDGVELDPATQHRFKIVEKGSLVITGVRISDSGNYICRARNVYGSRESPVAKLAVLVPPHVVSTSGDITGTSESTIELVCRVGGDPPPEVYWEKISEGELPIERLSQEENGQVLRIRHVSSEDQGIYRCRAENPVGSVTNNISLVIHSRPVIRVSPREARVGVNGTVSFECKTSGNPPPTTYWTHEGTGVVVGTGQTLGEGRVFVDSLNTLTLRSVTKDDQGYYVCSAVGVAGSALARAHLEVQSVTDMPPPLIALGAPNQTLPLGTEGEMPCEARGTPEPRILWFEEDKPFVASDRASVTPFGTLRITDLKTSDTGVYTCKATSESGTTEWTTSLVVAKPTNPNVAFFKMPRDTALPEPPQHVTVQTVNRTVATLGWRRGRPGSSPILGYSVQLWSPDLRGPWASAVTRPTSLTAMPVGVEVTGLVPDTRYVFVVRASNSHGLSRPSDVTPMIRTITADSQGDVTLRDIRGRLAAPAIRLVTVEAVSSSSLKVTWQLLIDDALLEGVYARYRPIKEPDNSSSSLSVETVFLHKKRSSPANAYLITGLRPATEYEVFVSPFYESVEGQPSAAVRSVTLESSPEAAPSGFQYSFLNDTTVRLTWKPIPPRLANGKIIGYQLKVFDVSEARKLLVNETSEKTWADIVGLIPGSAYHATVLGMTGKGASPESLPLAFTLREVAVSEETGATGIDAGSRDFPPVSVENNYYLIIVIVSASVVVSIVLFVAIFFIYKHRRKSKANPYFGKSESKDPWCEYPECWNDSCKSIGVGTASTTANQTLHSIQRPYAKSDSSPTYCKTRHEEFDAHDHYKIKPAEDLYEDPDGLRLVSFAKFSGNKRCMSPEPYATTPLITEGHYKGSMRGKLPPNIPLKDNHCKPDEGLNLSPSDLASQKRMFNFNNCSDKESHMAPIFQFPPPPPAVPLDESFSDHNLSFNRRNEVGFTRFLQQQLPYSLGGSSFGGSSSGGSQKSHESPQVGPRFPQRNYMKIGHPQHKLFDRDNDCRLLPHQEVSLIVDPNMESYRDALCFHQKPPVIEYQGGQLRTFNSGSSQDEFRCNPIIGVPHSNNNNNSPPNQLENNPFDYLRKAASESEGYSQPHVNIGRDSPDSSAMGDGEESDSNVSSNSCCSSHAPPVDEAHEMNFVECLRAASDGRWVTRGDTMSTSDGSHYAAGASARPNKTRKRLPEHRGGHEPPRIEVPSQFSESVTSPLI